MNRIFLREDDEASSYAVHEKTKLGVIGMGQGAGATFVATALAKLLSMDKEKRTAFLEIGGQQLLKPMLYDMLGMDKRFLGREFEDFYKIVKESKPIKGVVNLEERINWALCVPGATGGSEVNRLTSGEYLRLINNVSGDFIVCDFDGGIFTKEREEGEQLLREMDALVLVVDPLPSRLLSAEKLAGQIACMEYKGMPVVTVINKLNNGINKREFFNYMKLKRHVDIPLIRPELIYTAEYNCRIPFCQKEVWELIREPIEEILQLHKISILI